MKVDDPARRRRPDEGEGEQVGDGGLPKVARAVGRAFGVFRRLSPKARPEQPRKKVAEGGRLARRAARGAPEGAGPVDAQRRTAALQQQIHELESELEPLYHLIAHGRSGRGAASEARRELADLVQHARTLKETLQEKRLELARVQRRMARERLLAVTAPAEPAPAEQHEPVGRRAKGRPGAKEPAGAPQRMRQAVQRAAKQTTAKDMSRELIFDKTARGMLDEDPDIRRTSALRLGELDDHAAHAVLEAGLEDPEEKVRVASMNALARLGDPAAAGVFERHVEDQSPHVRLAALRGLAKIGSAAATTQLVAALEDDAPAVRKTVATLLGWRGSPGVAGPLILALRDEDDEVRAAAATSLAALRDDRAVLPLIRALADGSPEVRAAARRSLRALVGEDLEIPRGADPAERLAALKAWWIDARVTKAIAQVGMPLLPDETLAEPALPDAVARRSPPAEEPPARPAAQAAAKRAAPAAAAPQSELAGRAGEPSRAAAPPETPQRKPRPEIVEEAELDERRADDLDGLLSEEPEGAATPEGLDDLLPAEERGPGAGAGDGAETAAAQERGDEEGFEDILEGGDEDLDALVAESLTDDNTGR